MIGLLPLGIIVTIITLYILLKARENEDG